MYRKAISIFLSACGLHLAMPPGPAIAGYLSAVASERDLGHSTKNSLVSQGQFRIIRNEDLGIEFQIPASLRAVASTNSIDIYTQSGYEELQYILRNQISTEYPEAEAFILIVQPLPHRLGTVRENIQASHAYFLSEGFGFGSATLSGVQGLTFMQGMFRSYNARRIAAISPNRDFMLIIGSGESYKTYDSIVNSLRFRR